MKNVKYYKFINEDILYKLDNGVVYFHFPNSPYYWEISLYGPSALEDVKKFRPLTETELFEELL